MMNRIRVVLDRPPSVDRAYVLYWMIGARRSSWNFALDRAVDWARQLGKPLLVLEALDRAYPWSGDRIQQFVLDGMRDNDAAFRQMGVGYYPYVEREPHQGRGLLQGLAASAAVVVTDWAPVFRLPALVAAASRRVGVRFEAVDGSGIVPIDAPPAGAVFPSAYAFRRFLQRVLIEHLEQRPRSRAVTAGDLPALPAVPAPILERWPRATDALDATAGPGGSAAALRRLTTFVEQQLVGYDANRNHPDLDAGSGLSPYLHFGHVSAHEIVSRVLERWQWRPEQAAESASGQKQGWWRLPADAEAFLDQLITWRELGFNMAARRADYDRYESLPLWAQATLEAHANDPRPHLYTRAQLEQAETRDPLWNAAQRQLVREGRLHNYLRMLWGKKILEWTASPREALDTMIELNNRYALDGRDPNSYSGIFWVLGRYDRPWPERAVFGKIRSMTSQSTARKVRVSEYLKRYGPAIG